MGVIVVNRMGKDEYMLENPLVNVAVKEGLWRKGIGKALIKHTKKHCKEDIGTYINIKNSVVKLFENRDSK